MTRYNPLILLCIGLHATNAFLPGLPRRSTSTALKSKNNDRARVEKTLEDMMNNDWRVFRANLVAKEALEAEAKEKSSLGTDDSNDNPDADDKQAKQEKFGNIFAAIFSNHREGEKKDIFHGDAIGGATSHSMIPENCEDPFVSAAEVPVLLSSPKVCVDKHRWAHAISHIEPGCVLVANEKLGGVFHQTIVLVIEHNEAAGSTGIVINRPLNGNLLKVASETVSHVDLSLKMAFNSASVTYGGPVMEEEYSVLHGYGEVDGSKKVAPGVFVGGSEELMNEVRKHNLDPRDALFVKGHAAWVPNQLSREISKGVWYVASCSADLILRYAGAPVEDEDSNNNQEDLWSEILTCMGGKYADIASQHIGKGDRRAMP